MGSPSKKGQGVHIPLPTLLPIKDLKRDPANPNTMTQEQKDRLWRMIQKVGFHPPVLCNKDLMIIDGHQRVDVAEEHGMTEVPVTVMPVDRVTHVLLQQWYNKFRGTHDPDKDLEAYTYLQENNALGELESYLPEINLSTLHHMDTERGEDENATDEEIIEKAKAAPKYQLQPGDVYELGPHRLMCGDSTEKADVATLMTGTVADAVFIDPPYNLVFNGTKGDFDVFANDKLQEEEYQAFTKRIVQNLRDYSAADASWYVCIDFKNYPTWAQTCKQEGGTAIRNCIVWDKVYAGLGQRYRFRHEFIIYATRSPKSPWYGTTNEEDVLEINKDKVREGARILDMKGFSIPLRSGKYLRIKVEDSLPGKVEEVESPEEGEPLVMRTDPKTDQDVWEGFSMNYFSQREREHSEGIIHPTMKPLRLIQDLLVNVTKRQDIVLDLCAGSGSTLLACEQTKRRAHCMEIDPVYCSVIIERWERLTGQKARKVEE